MVVFELCDDVDGNYKGEGVWWRGVITARHDDMTYDVAYVDGDKEYNMDAESISQARGW